MTSDQLPQFYGDLLIKAVQFADGMPVSPLQAKGQASGEALFDRQTKRERTVPITEVSGNLHGTETADWKAE